MSGASCVFSSAAGVMPKVRQNILWVPISVRTPVIVLIVIWIDSKVVDFTASSLEDRGVLRRSLFVPVAEGLYEGARTRMRGRSI